MWVTPGHYLALHFIRAKKVYKPFCLSLTFHVWPPDDKGIKEDCGSGARAFLILMDL